MTDINLVIRDVWASDQPLEPRVRAAVAELDKKFGLKMIDIQSAKQISERIIQNDQR